MKNYELIYLIPTTLSEEEQKKISEKISSLIQDKGGILKTNEAPVKRILSKEVKQQKEIFSVSLGFYANPEKMPALQDDLKAEKEIIRFMLVIKEAPTAAKPVRKRIKEEPQKKVELKDVEEKIEEILKE